MSAFFDVFRSRRMAILAALGFVSGLPLLLTGQTLGAWLTQSQADLTTIGKFTAVSLPYSFKWLWAPLLDRYRLPWLGRRRGWVALFQILLVGAIALLGTADPRRDLGMFAAFAVLVALLSASQDLVIDAYKADLLAPEERAAGAAVFVLGYRLAMLVAGTLSLIAADHVPWRWIYLGMALLMAPGVLITLIAEEPPRVPSPPRSLGDAIVVPLTRLFRRPAIVRALLFVMLYKLGDQLASPVLFPFLNRQLGFTGTQIAAYNKICGFAGTAVGGLMAGALMTKMPLRRALIVFGVLQAATNFGYAALATLGHSHAALAAAVTLDNLANATGTGAMVTLLMALCDARASATQYALLSSLSTILGRVLGASIGPMVTHLGWPLFFAMTAVAALPGLALAASLRDATMASTDDDEPAPAAVSAAT